MADEPIPTPEKGGDPAPEPKTLTQAEIDKIVENRLAREREKQQAEREAEKQRLEDEKKSEVEKLASQIQALQKQVEEQTARADKADLDALRAKVAQAKSLPAGFASRLTGSTQEELEADADAILEVIGGSKEDDPEPKGFGRPREKLTPGAGGSGDDDEVDPDKLAEKILSRHIL